MRPALAAAGLVLMLGRAAYGHRLDEYLQATTIALEKNSISVQLRLTPGVAVFRHVAARIDPNGDGVLTRAEQESYAQQVLADLSLSLDGHRLQLHPVSTVFPKLEQMKEGLGEIQLDFAAVVPDTRTHRKLVFENRHQKALATYLVNGLVPADPGILITSQNRNYQQSLYQLDYAQAGVQPSPFSSAWWSWDRAGLGALTGLLFAAMALSRPRRRTPTARAECAESACLPRQ